MRAGVKEGPGVSIKGARCLLQPFCSVAMSTLSQKSARISAGFVELAGIWRTKGAFGGNADLQRATGGFSCMPCRWITMPACSFWCTVNTTVSTVVPYSNTYAYNLAVVPSICSLHHRGHDNQRQNRVDSADSGGIGIRY
jgi:hypothetical protein